MPSLAAAIVVGTGEGREGVARLFGKFIPFRVPLRWYLASLIPAGLTVLTVLAYRVTGGLPQGGVADPAQPALLGFVAVPDVEEVAVLGTRAYLAVDVEEASGGGLVIADVADPQAPAIIGRYGILDARDVAVAGHLA